MDTEQWVTATQAARICHRSVRRIWSWREQGLFPSAYKRYQVWHIAVSDLLALQERFGFIINKNYLATLPRVTGLSTEETIAALQRQVTALAAQITAQQRPMSIPSPIIHDTNYMMFGRPELPLGSLQVIQFARTHQVPHSTIKSQISAGKIHETLVPTVARDKRSEHWVSPQQQYDIIVFWNRNNTIYVACGYCPHGEIPT